MKERKKQNLILRIMLIIIVSSCFLLLNLALNIMAAPSNSQINGARYDARQVFDFNAGWRFSKGEGIENFGSSTVDAIPTVYIPNNSQTKVYSNAYVEGENFETWKSVSLPHTYNDTDTFDDYVEALDNNGVLTSTQNGERSVYGGTAWYKKTFFVPSEYEGKQIYIEFESARQSCQIWINGVAVFGKNLNGFIAFGYDLTSYLNYGEENTITVLVDNSYPYYVSVNNNGTPDDPDDDFFETMYDIDEDGGTITTNNPIPWHDSQWHPNYGGLYRNSYLYVLNDLHLTLPLYSFMETQGTYVYTSNENASTKTASINVKAEVKNFNSVLKNYSFLVRIFDMNGNIVETSITNETIAGNTTAFLTKEIQITNVKRWSPDYPYLYTVECSLWEGNVCVDNNSTDIGVRTFRATTDGGFLINENYLYLEGWEQQSTMEWAGIGSAYPDWMQEYVLQLMKDAGANYLRWGGTAGSKTQIEIADKIGLIITQPGVDGEGNNGTIDYNAITSQIRIDAFRDMVIQFRNSPSILFWELGNFADADGSMDDIYTALREIVETYDFANRDTNGDVQNFGTYNATRNLTASTRLCTSKRINSKAVAELCEVAETTQGNNLESDYDENTIISGKPLLEAENNHFEARRGVWDTSTYGFSNFSNICSEDNDNYENMTSELLAVETVKQYYNNLLTKGLGHMGGANFVFSDSIIPSNIFSEVANTAGEIDASMLPKESYYVSKVLYNPLATSHIIGHWNYTEGTTKTVYVVSKSYSVELQVPNGQGGYITYNSQSPNYLKSDGYLFTFTNIPWHSGTISVQGFDEHGDEILQSRDSITTVGAPVGIRISSPIGNPNGLKANGSDYLILDVELIDANGNRCVYYDGQVNNLPINFTISNENLSGVWCGSYNSFLENTIHQKNIYVEAGIARVALRTTLTSGNIHITATLLNSFGNVYSAKTSALEDLSTVGNAVNDDYYNYTILPEKQKTILTYLTEPAYGSILPVAPLESDYSANYENMQHIRAIVSADSNYLEYVNNFNIGNFVYRDLNMVYKDIPTKYINAEMVFIPNSYYQYRENNLFSFSLLHNCSMILLFPLQATIPSWVNDFAVAQTSYSTISYLNINNCEHNGIIYKVFEIPLTALDENNIHNVYHLGSVSPTNNYDYMYLFGFYVPSNINQGDTNYTASTQGGYFEPFSTATNEIVAQNTTSYLTDSGYYICKDSRQGTAIPTTSSAHTDVEMVYDNGNEYLKLIDYANAKNNTTALPAQNDEYGASFAGIFMPTGGIAPSGGVSSTATITFDFLLQNNTITYKDVSKYFRVLLYNGSLSSASPNLDNINSGIGAVYRYYMDLDGTTANRKILQYFQEANQTQSGKSNTSFYENQWLKIKIDIDFSGTTNTITFSLGEANSVSYVHINQKTLSSTPLAIDYVGFLTGGNSYGTACLKNFKISYESVPQVANNTITGIGINTLSSANNKIVANISPNNTVETAFSYSTTAYIITNFLALPTTDNVNISVSSATIKIKKWVNLTEKSININAINGNVITSYKIYFSVSGANSYLNVLNTPLPYFSLNTSFYYMGEFNAQTNPMPTSSSDFSSDLGDIRMLTSTASDDYNLKKRVEIQLVNNIGIIYNYALSYSYYSEYYRYSGKEFKNLVDLQNHEYRNIELNYLYAGNTMYDTGVKINSVPYKFSGAEYIQTDFDNFSSHLEFYARFDSTMILLVNTHDIIQILMDGNVNNDEIINGWYYSEEIVTFDDGTVYSIFTKQIQANTLTSFNYADFATNYEFSPILCLTKTYNIINNVFLYENFNVVDETTGLPYGFIVDQDLPTSDSDTRYAKITYSSDEDGKFIFEDTSLSNDGGKFASLQKSFSDIQNKFIFSTQIKISSTGNVNSSNVSSLQYIRLWLLDGPADFVVEQNHHADNFGIECYLHEYTNNTIKLFARSGRDSNNIDDKNLATSLPYDTWIRINFHIDTQKHSFYTIVEYIDSNNDTISQTSTQQLFATKTSGGRDFYVDKINNLTVASSSNSGNSFSLREISISRVEEDVISGIKINNNNITTFNELTNDYMYIMQIGDALPNVSVVADSNYLNCSINLDSSTLYYSIILTDKTSGTHLYRIFLYVDTTVLQARLNTLLGYNLLATDYSQSSWASFIEATIRVQELLDSHSHNYSELNTALINLNRTYDNLVIAYSASIILHDEVNGAAEFSTMDTRFAENENVFVNTIPNAGYFIQSITAIDENNNPISVIMLTCTSATFVMPNANVDIHIYFTFGRTMGVELGKSYVRINNINTSLSITPKSAVSIQYTNYLNMPGINSLSIDIVPSGSWTYFPQGTLITMLDMSAQPASYGQYHYTCQTNNISRLPLTLFTKMGMGTNYFIPTYTFGFTHDLIFIFDFRNVDVITSGSITLIYKNAGVNLFDTNQIAEINIVNDITTAISTTLINTPKYFSDIFLFATEIVENSENNSIFKDNEQTIVISMNNNAEFPAQTVIKFDDKLFSFTNDYKYATFILNQASSGVISIDTTSSAFTTNPIFNFYLYSSQLGNYWANGIELCTQEVEILNLTQPPTYALKACLDNTNSIISNNTSAINVNLQYANITNADSVEISIFEKNEDDYILDTSLLTSCSLGEDSVAFTNGIADIKSLLNGISSTITLNLNASSMPLTTTTYKIVISIIDNNRTILSTETLFIILQQN